MTKTYSIRKRDEELHREYEARLKKLYPGESRAEHIMKLIKAFMEETKDGI